MKPPAISSEIRKNCERCTACRSVSINSVKTTCKSILLVFMFILFRHGSSKTWMKICVCPLLKQAGCSDVALDPSKISLNHTNTIKHGPRQFNTNTWTTHKCCCLQACNFPAKGYNVSEVHLKTYHQKFQLPKMEVLNLTRPFWQGSLNHQPKTLLYKFIWVSSIKISVHESIKFDTPKMDQRTLGTIT